MMVRTDHSLEDVLALDRVQKGLPIADEAALRLRKAELIGGRRPRLHVSANSAAVTGRRADYIRTRRDEKKPQADLRFPLWSLGDSNP
jgi:ATP-dependent DNA helicase RecG